MMLLRVWLTGLCVLAYAFMWYQGELIPAWQAMIWVALAFVNDLDEYFHRKFKDFHK